MNAHSGVTEEVVSRLADLSAKHIRTVESADVVEVDSSTMFFGLHPSLLLVVVAWDQIADGISQQANWFNSLIYQCVANSPVVPIILTDGQDITCHVAELRSRGTAGLKGQPVLKYTELQKLQTSQASDLLRQVIIESPLSHTVIPYRVHTAAVRGMFFGRNKELYELQHKRGHFFIVGARRIGKTSLATRLVDTINHEQKHAKIELGGNFLVDKKAVQIDVSSLGENTSTTLWTEILRQFAIDPNRWKLYSRKISQKRNAPTEDPAFALQALIETAHGKLTIVLDEVDGWIKSKSNWPTIDRLRSLTDGDRAKLVLVGYELLRTALQNDKFPLYERGTRITLGPIDRNTMTELVTRPLSEFGIEIQSPEVITRLWKMSGGMPHIVQDVCSILLNKCLDEKRKLIGTTHVSQAFKDSQKYNDFIRGVSKCGFPLAEAIAGIIANNSKGSNVPTSNIIGALKKFGYVFDNEEFELALDYLELRYTIIKGDIYRGSWRIFNDGQREYMCHNIANKTFDDWLTSLIKKHNTGQWKKAYEDVL